MKPAFSLPDYLKAKTALIDEALAGYFSENSPECRLICRSARYSLLAGGKRIRPVLCIATAETLGARAEDVLPAACALEMIHAYSLIHDDLPAMDNDDYRRGQWTSHKVFGEDIAILAGDALLTEAFTILTDRTKMPKTPAWRLLTVSREIAEAAGYQGMVGGQALDVRMEGKKGDLEELYAIHRLKTGALLRASVRCGAILAGARKKALDDLTAYGERIGLAFQIADDMLNVEGDSKLLGKETGSDAKHGKMTFPALLGMEASHKKAQELINEAVSFLCAFKSRAAPLEAIARYIVSRRN
jgi:geranylgeranyl diphosphate synthase, type II